MLLLLAMVGTQAVYCIGLLRELRKGRGISSALPSLTGSFHYYGKLNAAETGRILDFENLSFSEGRKEEL